MAIEIKVPALPESVADATVSKWHKKPGDAVTRDETLVDIETDKVVLEVPAPEDGILEAITKPEGTTVNAEEVIGTISTSKAAAATTPKAALPGTTVAEINGSITQKPMPEKTTAAEAPAAKVSAAAVELSPAVRRMIAELDIDPSQIKGTGKEGRITKEDVQKHLQQQPPAAHAAPQPSKPAPQKVAPLGAREEQRVPMSRLRTRIAERLLNAQQTMAMLTTFNEINMKAVMDLRSHYNDQFEKIHHVRLGFMSFFVRATIAALKRFPDVNASVDGNDIVYHGYCDIGVAVSSERGLVVPVLRDADLMSMAEIEAEINAYGIKARDGKLTIEEMSGGTFTISNGGVFGSLLSTPIINPPQSAILGMHKIEDRPVVEAGQIVIRPMMYVALTYDHRIIDGKDSVQFLRTIKELLEDPARLLLDV